MKNIILILLLLSSLDTFSQNKNEKSYDKNTYFFISLPEPAFEAILEHCVSKKIENTRKLYDGSYIVKLPMNAITPSVLSSYKQYTHAETLIEIAIREKGRPQL